MPKTCIYCGLEYAMGESPALYPEAFCSNACERRFGEHLASYYGIGDGGLRILAVMPQGNA